MKSRAMDIRGSAVKEEAPLHDGCYGVKTDYTNTLGPSKLIKDEPEDNGFRAEATSYDANFLYDSKPLCAMKLESNGGFVKMEEEDRNSYETASSYQLESIVPMKLESDEYTAESTLTSKVESVELETLTENTLLQYSRDCRYASPWDFVLATNTSGENNQTKNAVRTESVNEDVVESEIDNTMILKEKFIENTFNLNFKTESVELETLNEKTIMQSSRDYASPWDFLSVKKTNNQSALKESTAKRRSEDDNLSENIINQKYEGENCYDNFFRDSSTTPAIQNSRLTKKKFVQQTLMFDSVCSTDSRSEEVTVKVSEKLPEHDVMEHISEHQPQPLVEMSDAPPSKFYSCTFCDEDFMSEMNLIRHNHNKHSDSIKTAKCFCDICGRPVADLSLLRRHRATHDPTQRYECDVCEKKFKLKSYLRQHLNTHNRKYHGCDYCSRHYTRSSSLRRHMKIHRTKYVESEKASDINDEAKIGGEPLESESVKIKVPGSQVSKNKKKKIIEESSKWYKCDICGKHFNKKSSIRVHIEFLHMEVFNEDTNKTNYRSRESSRLVNLSKKRFQCHICKKRYTQLSHLYRHQKIHQSIKSNFCEICSQHFATTSSLRRHFLNKHNKSNSAENKSKTSKKTGGEFDCKICYRSFTTSADLRRHCATHDGRKPYECDICNKKFAVKGYLYAHILTHDNWQPYPCGLCDKVYRRKSSLQRHIAISH